jgi:hypothetical protein
VFKLRRDVVDVMAMAETDIDILDRHSTGAEMVAWVFKVAAVVVVICGIFGAVVVGFGHASMSVEAYVAAAIGIGLGAVFVSAGLAFFGYVLDLLVGIKSDMGLLSYLALESDDDDQH